jgi:P pilus assembly chaperone PapD
MRSLVLFLALVAALTAASPVALAAQLSVEQLVVQLQPADGETSILIPVRNEGAESVVAEIATGDWRVDAEGRHSFHPAGTLAYSCGDDLRVDVATVRIEPGATAEVRVTHSGAATDRCRNIVFFRVTERLLEFDGDNLIVTTGVKVYVEP